MKQNLLDSVPRRGIRRGDIYYIRECAHTGSEMCGNRPGIIVSNERNNVYSSTVEVVYLTTQGKKQLPTHVPIQTAKHPSTALCEQVTTVSKERINGYIGRLTLQERLAVDRALAISLELNQEATGGHGPDPRKGGRDNEREL